MKHLLFLCIATLLWSSCSNAPLRIKTIGAFCKEVPECSGLIMWDNNLLSINDSGNKPTLHVVHTKTAEHKDAQTVLGTTNTDWEAIASDSNYIYVGDFGNNEGHREDLTIYKIKKGNRKLGQISKIPFGYRGQNQFEKRDSHNYDCEAMIVDDGMITLFSKNRADDSSSVYLIDPKQSMQFPAKEYTFETKYMITDATLHQPSGKVVCAAYNYIPGGFDPAILVLRKINDKYTTEHILPLDFNHQIEGITWTKKNTFYLGSESEEGLKGSLFELKLNKKILNQ